MISLEALEASEAVLAQSSLLRNTASANLCSTQPSSETTQPSNSRAASPSRECNSLQAGQPADHAPTWRKVMSLHLALLHPMPKSANYMFIFHASTPSSPIILYLPPGPVLPDCHEEQVRVLSTLRESSGATVARINYRASPSNQYPTPCHDVLAGYDWIREHLLRDDFKRPYIARLGVCGELVGASLATMLALTENRLGLSGIAAAAVNNPIADWVFPDDLPSGPSTQLPEPVVLDETALHANEDLGRSKAAQGNVREVSRKCRKRPTRAQNLPSETSWQLHGENMIIPALALTRERDLLFCRPEDRFDRFASPIHFFRSPRAQLRPTERADLSTSPQPDELLDIETRMHLNHYASFGESTQTVPALPILTRCRSYARNYPSAGTKQSFPVWTITTGLHSPLSDQSAELAKAIRRSMARHMLKTHSGRARWHDVAEKERYEDVAFGQVHLNVMPGVGLWSRQDDNPEWKNSVEEVGIWMRRGLESGLT